MMSPLISIIVPVYNVEAYLPACLDSLLRQGIDDEQYEVVLVNDGSTDDSESICKDYVAQHANFFLLNQENQGVAAARNHGLDFAHGEYVIFVDSDDFLADNGLKRLVNVLKSHPGIDLVRFYSSYNNHIFDGKDEIDYEGKADKLLLSGGYPAFVWTFAYRKEFLDEHRIRFAKLRFSEDSLFIATVFLQNPSVCSTRANIYRYVLRQDSAVGKRDKIISRLSAEDGISAYEQINQEMEKSVFAADNTVRDTCIASMNRKKAPIYSRLLGAAYNWGEFKIIRQRIIRNSFYPMRPWNNDHRTKVFCVLLNLIFSNYVSYKFVSCFFNQIFTPYILPAYRKRVWSSN
mgnify:FL=1